MIRIHQTLSPNRIIEMCQHYPASFDTEVSAVGLGSTTRFQNVPATTLQEINLKLSPFQTLNRSSFADCPTSLVCTQTIIDDSGLCYHDVGDPLFMWDCQTHRPLCLLGIATPTLKDESPLRDCTGQADFTSIPFFHDWIFTRIALNME